MNQGAASNNRSLFDRLLRRAGISPRPFRALVGAFLLMDFRNQQFGRSTATGPKAVITPLFWVVGQNVILSGVLTVVLFARVDALFFTLLNLGTSMLVMATSLIVEFNEVVLDPGDLEVIGHQPVPVRTYSAARVTNLLGYVLLMTVSLNVFPAIGGLGLRETSWTFLPAYVAAALVGNLLVTGAVILLYTLVAVGRPNERAQELLAWNQIILILLFFYGGQAIFRDPGDRLEMAAYRPPEWVAYMPPTWLAGFVDTCRPDSQGAAWWILGGMTATTVAAWGAVMWRLSGAYARMQPGSTAWRRAVLPPLPRPGELAGRLARLLTRPHEERTAYWLCATMLKRDHNLRMRSWPSLGVVFAALALGWFTGQLADPLASPGHECVLSLACVYLLAVPIPTIFHNLRFSRNHTAAWILRTAPIADAAAFAEGLRKAVTYRILVPVLLVLLVAFALAWRDPLHVLVHVAVGWLVVLGAGYASAMGILRSVPFSAPLARGESFGPIALFAGSVSGVAVFLAVVHYHVLKSAPGLVAYLAGLVVLVLVLRELARRVLSRRFAVEVLHE